MSKRLKYFTLIVSALLFLVFVGNDEVSAACFIPSSCAYSATAEHVVEPLTCYGEEGSSGDLYWYFYAYDYWNGDPTTISTLNYINADDHPAYIGDSQTITPGDSLIFTAPSSVTISGDKVVGLWIRMHDNEDNATYSLQGCDVNESGSSCSTGWYTLKNEEIHTSGNPGVEVCTQTLKGDAAHDGCPDPEPKVPECSFTVRENWPCAISYDEHRWDNGSCGNTNVKKVRINFGGTVDSGNGHIHLRDYIWILRKPDPSTCSVSPSSATVTANSSGLGTVSVNLNGRFKGSGSTPVRFWFQRKDGIRLPSGGEGVVSPAEQPYLFDSTTNSYSYRVTGLECTSSNGALCSKTTNLTLPASDYYFFCDVVKDANDAYKCSGNVGCNYETIKYPSGGPLNCTSLNYRSCSNSDNASFGVNLPCVSPAMTCEPPSDPPKTRATLNTGFGAHSADQYRVWRYNSAGTSVIESQDSALNPAFPFSKVFAGPSAPALASGTTYRYAVTAQRPGDTAFPSAASCTKTPLVCYGNSSCTIAFNPVHSSGSPGLLMRNEVEENTVQVGEIGGVVTEMTFTEAGSVISVMPPEGVPNASNRVYLEVTGLAGATIGAGTTLTATATMNTGATCTQRNYYKIEEYSNWWQMRQGDAWTVGNISSVIPTGNVFNDRVGMGYTGFPGIPFYGGTRGGNLTDTANISNKGWNADTGSFFATPLDVDGKPVNALDYDYFWNLLPEEVKDNITTLSASEGVNKFNTSGYEYPVDSGYYWFKRTGDFTLINSADLGVGRKVIVFVDSTNSVNGNVTINGRPVPEAGKGLFMVIAKRDINVSPSIQSLYGLFVADGRIHTGSAAGEDTDSALTVNGSLVAWGGGVLLERDLGADISNPGEVVIYRPDMVLNLPKYFSEQTVTRKEVNP
jgi:hypothetical protein